ncbi:MAG: helix-turn-helix domain-containing protein [Archangium sp.]
MASVNTFAPIPELAAYVRELRVVESVEGMERVLVPETCLIAGFRYGGAAFLNGSRMPDASLAGLRTTARTMVTKPGSGMIAVSFTTLGASSFFTCALHELMNGHASLNELWKRDVTDEVTSSTSRVLAVQKLLLEQRIEREPDALVAFALTKLHNVRVGELAREVGLSRDRFEKRFRRAVGTSAKHFASLLRVRRVMQLRSSLGERAHEAGYFDQSHMNREFKAMLGEAPGRFFRDVEFC